MCYYVQELKQHEMIVEAKPDFFNSLYCIDIYIKIKKGLMKEIVNTEKDVIN